MTTNNLDLNCGVHGNLIYKIPRYCECDFRWTEENCSLHWRIIESNVVLPFAALSLIINCITPIVYLREAYFALGVKADFFSTGPHGVDMWTQKMNSVILISSAAFFRVMIASLNIMELLDVFEYGVRNDVYILFLDVARVCQTCALLGLTLYWLERTAKGPTYMYGWISGKIRGVMGAMPLFIAGLLLPLIIILCASRINDTESNYMALRISHSTFWLLLSSYIFHVGHKLSSWTPLIHSKRSVAIRMVGVVLSLTALFEFIAIGTSWDGVSSSWAWSQGIITLFEHFLTICLYYSLDPVAWRTDFRLIYVPRDENDKAVAAHRVGFGQGKGPIPPSKSSDGAKSEGRLQTFLNDQPVTTTAVHGEGPRRPRFHGETPATAPVRVGAINGVTAGASGAAAAKKSKKSFLDRVKAFGSKKKLGVSINNGVDDTNTDGAPKSPANNGAASKKWKKKGTAPTNKKPLKPQQPRGPPGGALTTSPGGTTTPAALGPSVENDTVHDDDDDNDGNQDLKVLDFDHLNKAANDSNGTTRTPKGTASVKGSKSPKVAPSPTKSPSGAAVAATASGNDALLGPPKFFTLQVTSPPVPARSPMAAGNKSRRQSLAPSVNGVTIPMSPSPVSSNGSGNNGHKSPKNKSPKLSPGAAAAGGWIPTTHTNQHKVGANTKTSPTGGAATSATAAAASAATYLADGTLVPPNAPQVGIDASRFGGAGRSYADKNRQWQTQKEKREREMHWKAKAEELADMENFDDDIFTELNIQPIALRVDPHSPMMATANGSHGHGAAAAIPLSPSLPSRHAQDIFDGRAAPVVMPSSAAAMAIAKGHRSVYSMDDIDIDEEPLEDFYDHTKAEKSRLRRASLTAAAADVHSTGRLYRTLAAPVRPVDYIYTRNLPVQSVQQHIDDMTPEQRTIMRQQRADKANEQLRASYGL